MSSESLPDRIEIPGDVLVLDADFCKLVLAGATRRTASRLDAEGLPFAMIRGRKYRPLNEGRAWLAARIQRKGQEPSRRRARRATHECSMPHEKRKRRVTDATPPHLLIGAQSKD